MTVLLKEAMRQIGTNTEHTPAFIHGGLTILPMAVIL